MASIAVGWFFNYAVPLLSLAAAAMAAYFGQRALTAIQKQIGLANQQIEIANEQIELANRQIAEARTQTSLAQSALDLANKEFDATIETLRITRREATIAETERSRKPNVVVTFGLISEKPVLRLRSGVGIQSNISPVQLRLDIAVLNNGRRPATNAVVEVMTSKNLEMREKFAQGPIIRRPTAWGAEFVLGEAEIFNDAMPHPIGYVLVYGAWGEHALYWRVQADEGAWPPANEEDALEKKWHRLPIRIEGGFGAAPVVVPGHPLASGSITCAEDEHDPGSVQPEPAV
ncbi:MAG TPA: hypothetical protein VMD91_08505 [Candidatus Sulfotelmatobacter sp.]|nr:hypothetical protein [Candidatus Sulfotelmatobacter sp.]